MENILDPIVYGLFSVLKSFHALTGNWGWAIVILTVAIRVVLLPLTIKQTASMRKMQEIQPQLTALRDRYKDDKERQAQEMMKFYKQNKVNPMAGCLPLLPQIPILLSLYWMLTDVKINQHSLEGAGFLWIPDLSHAHDITLVLLMAVTQVVSMVMVTKDPQQRKMMIPMALIFPIITWGLPAGVVLYWVTMNIFVIAQQWIQFHAPHKTLFQPSGAASSGASAATPPIKGGSAPKKVTPPKNGAAPSQGPGAAESSPDAQVDAAPTAVETVTPPPSKPRPSQRKGGKKR